MGETLVIQEEQLEQRPPQAEAESAPPSIEAAEPEAAEVVEPSPEPAGNPAEPAESDGEPIHVTDIEHGDDDNGTNTQWDEPKAYTMAAVLTDAHKPEGIPKVYDGEPSGFDKAIAHKDHIEDWVKSEKFVDDTTKSELGNRQRERKSQRLARGTENEDSAAAADRVRKDAKTWVEHSKERVDETVDRVLLPYEGLYDLNPTAFAEMPTSKFMAEARELTHINVDRAAYEEGFGEAQRLSAAIDEWIGKRREVEGRDVNNLYDKAVRLGRGMDNDSFGAFKNELEAITADTFDKTPRQILGEYRDLAQRQQKRLADERVKTDQARQALLDKYKPEPSPTPEAGAEEQPAA